MSPKAKLLSLALAAALALAPAAATAQGAPQVSASWLPMNRLAAPITATSTPATAALPAGGDVANVCNTGAVDAYVKVGPSTVAVTATTGSWVKASSCSPVQLRAAGGSPIATTLAHVTASGSTTLNVETGVGTPPVSLVSIGGENSNVTIVGPLGQAQPAASVPVVQSPAAAASTAALASNKTVKTGAGSLSGLNVAADSTLYAADWWIMVFDATSPPADGAVSPLKCYPIPAGARGYAGAFPAPVTVSAGAVIVVSTTGCFIKTASAHAFISGDAQ